VVCKRLKQLKGDFRNRVILTGGNSMFPGFLERFRAEMAKNLGDEGFKVYASQNRVNDVVDGGKIFCSLPQFAKAQNDLVYYNKPR